MNGAFLIYFWPWKRIVNIGLDNASLLKSSIVKYRFAIDTLPPFPITKTHFTIEHQPQNTIVKHSIHAPARFILPVSKTRCPVLSLPFFHHLYYNIWYAVRSNKKPLFKRKISWIYRKFTEKEKNFQNYRIFLFLPVTQIYIDI